MTIRFCLFDLLVSGLMDLAESLAITATTATSSVEAVHFEPGTVVLSIVIAFVIIGGNVMLAALVRTLLVWAFRE